MSASQETVDHVDEYMRRIFLDCAGPAMPRHLWDSSSFRMHIQNKLFGNGVTTLRSKEQVLFVDDPNYDPASGVTGIRAIRLTEAAWQELQIEIEQITQDVAFRDKLSALSDVNAKMKLIYDSIIDRIINKQAFVSITAIDPNNPDIINLINDPAQMPTVKPTGTERLVMEIKNRFAKWLVKKGVDVKKVPDITSIVMQTAGSAAQLAVFAGIWAAEKAIFGKLPLLLGPCPLKHVEYVEVARSGKKLKFRATGSVFLASQEGGDQQDAIRIEGKLYKSEFGFMFLLWFLFLYGQSKFRDMTFLNTLKVDNVADVRKINDILMKNSNLERPSYEYHRTFPFVNRHFIIPNCYIETISIEDKLPLKDTIRYSVLLRTYTKPVKVSKYVVDKKAGTEMYGVKSKALSTEILEYSLNIGWRLFNTEGYLMDTQEWKIGSAKREGVIDTYYDIDWSDLGTVSYLTLMGMTV